MSIGRDTLKATMKRTWNAIKNPFRRQTMEKTQLQDDYPTDIDSEFTDDEEQRREWQQHLNRRATIATEGMMNVGATSAGLEEYDDRPLNDKWDYVSEYSVSFPSDSSIIDAFKEKRYEFQANRYKKPDLSFKTEGDMNSYNYCMKEEMQPRHVKKRMSLHPQLERTRNNSFSTKEELISHRVDLKRVEREIIHDLENGPSKRRDSLHPYRKMTENLSLRRESSDRDSESGLSSFKRKIKKQIKQRKRAQHISPDESDVESIELKSPKYTVNITMDEIRDLIKKNVSSAVKTIADKNMKEKTGKRCISPIESFSTESETIFSGSSQSTDTQLGGLLQKQMNAQLDKNKLSGQRRASFALGYLNLPENEPAKMFNTSQKSPPISPVLSACHEQPPQIVIHDAPQQPQILVPDGSQFNDAHHLRVPQVTFNMNDTQSTVPSVFQFPAINTHRRNSIIMPSARRPSILPNADHGTYDPFNPHGQLGLNPHGQLGLPNSTPQLSPSAFNPMAPHTGYALQTQDNSFGATDSFGIPQDSINRLRMRRHTLAAGNPLNLGLNQSMGQFSASPLVPRRFETPANPGIDPRLDQLDNILKTLDASINNSDKTEIEIKNLDSASKNTTDSNTQERVNQIETRPLTIAEQIEALTKKQKKPLKPGQMGLTGCARAILIVINILFLLVGAGSLGVGIWMLMDPNIETYFDILNVDSNNQDFKMICYILCGIGGVVLFIGFMGCCGTIRSSKIMLTVFIIVTAVIILAEAGLGTILLINRDSTTAIPVLSALISELGGTLRAQLTRSVVEKYDPETTIGSAWDLVQIQGECCGSNGPDDYRFSAWKNTSNDKDISFPISCCVLITKDVKAPEPSNMLLCQTETSGFYHDTGCYDALLGWFQKNSSYLVAVLIAILAIEVFSLMFALAICRKAHKDILKYKDTPGIQ